LIGDFTRLDRSDELMNDGLGLPQTLVLLGGNSDIGQAIVRRLLSPSTRTVILASRNTDAGETAALALRQAAPGVTVEVVAFQGGAAETHEPLLRDLAARHGDLDVVIVAFGQLGDPELLAHDPVAAAALATVNFSGAISSCIAAANVMRAQGHGALVVLSSVAGERVRKANPVYGGTKAGLDGFAQGLGDALVGSGVKVLVVRPGFVHSQMTAGMAAAPFATTPEKVAEVTVKGLRSGRRTVWAPGILRYVFSALRHVPGPIWRRLPLG
jgi:decaprenylphospho-beta-D-erythro-pentofuranosid-2-ulose 2-reductase